jgi:chromosome partitioning protein
VKIIAITNQKGGVGKTTTAVNLSAALAEKGQRILLVDLDPQGNASSAIGAADPEAATIYEALVGERPVTELTAPTRTKNLSIVPANIAMAGCEIEVARMEEHLLRLRSALNPLRHASFDFVFLDCPPSLGILMSNALAAADEVLIPIQCEYYALEGLSLLMHVMNKIRNSGVNPQLGIAGLVMTMFDNRTNLNPAVVREVRDHFQEVVFKTSIPRTVRLAEAPSHGKTIFEHDPKGAGAAAYEALASEFLERDKAGMAFVWPSIHSC